MGLNQFVRRRGPLGLAALALLLAACSTQSSSTPASPATGQHTSSAAAAAPAAKDITAKPVPTGYTTIQGGTGDPAIGVKCVEDSSMDGLSPFYTVTFVNTSGVPAGVNWFKVQFSPTGIVYADYLDEATLQGQQLFAGIAVPANGQPVVVQDHDTQYSVDNPAATVPSSCTVLSYDQI